LLQQLNCFSGCAFGLSSTVAGPGLGKLTHVRAHTDTHTSSQGGIDLTHCCGQAWALALPALRLRQHIYRLLSYSECCTHTYSAHNQSQLCKPSARNTGAKTRTSAL